MTPDTDSITPDGEPLAPDPDMLARRQAVASQLVQLGFISEETAQQANPAVEVLGTLLPRDSQIGLCLSCHGLDCSGAYPFRETTGLFGRPGFAQRARRSRGRFMGVSLRRTELVLCTADALWWTRSEPRVLGGRAVGDDVTLYSVPFSDMLGAAVHDRHNGVVEAWIDDGPTLSFTVRGDELDALCSYIERAIALD